MLLRQLLSHHRLNQSLKTPPNAAKSPPACTARRRSGRRTADIRENDAREKERPPCGGPPKPYQMSGSGGCALGFFDLEAASDSVEHGHLSLLDRCDGIIDGERRFFVQQLGVIRSAFNAQIVLPLGDFRL